MLTSTKEPKRLQHRSKGSDSSVLTYSSSTTATSSESDWSISESQAPKKPWVIKALKTLGYNKIKAPKKGKDGPECLSKEKIRIVAKAGLSYDQYMVDSNEEAMAAKREARLEKEEELDLLPDFPDPAEFMLPSLHDRRIQRFGHRRPQIINPDGQVAPDMTPSFAAACRRSGSTPNLKEAAGTAKRLSEEDPFYLDKLLKKFPDVPTTVNPPRPCIIITPPTAPSSPRVRCSSDAPNSKQTLSPIFGAPGHAKHFPPSLIHRPIDKELLTRPRLASKASLPVLRRS